MNADQPKLQAQILKALAVVLIGAVVITAIHSTITTDTKPYYSIIAEQRVQREITIEKSSGATDDSHANSGTRTK